MIDLAAGLVDAHAHGERGAILVRTQRTEIVGDALGQHRHDAVGKVDRIAASHRLAIERGIRAYVIRNVGDGDGDDEAPFVVLVVVCFREHRVVVILGVGRVDGDERNGAPVFAPKTFRLHLRFFRGVGFGQSFRAKDVGYSVRRNGDLADRFFRTDGADDFAHARGRKTGEACAQNVDGDKIAVARVFAIAFADREFAAQLLLVDRLDAPTAAFGVDAKDAEHARSLLRQEFDDAARIFRRAGFGIALTLRAHQRAVADAWHGHAGFRAARHVQEDARRGAELARVPFDWARDQFAIEIAAGDVAKNDRRQDARLHQPLAAPLDRAFVLELSQDTLEVDLVGPLDAELARDLALADLRQVSARALARDEGENVVAGGDGLVFRLVVHER